MQLQQKNVYLFFFIIPFFLLSACNKIVNCSCQNEGDIPDNTTELKALENAPKLQDTLHKYKQLNVYKIINNEYTIGMHCDIYYKGLQVFFHQYALFQDKSDKSLHSLGDSIIVKSIPISLQPKIGCFKAQKIAKKNMDFNKFCLVNQLGIYDLNAGKGMNTVNYVLAWRVAVDLKEAPYVFINAQTGTILSSFDGVYY